MCLIKETCLILIQVNQIKMIKKILVLFFFSWVVTTGYGQTVQIPISTNIQARNGKQFYVHQVRKGQTVYSIAKAYHVGIDEIYYNNPAAKNGLRIGQSLWIPTENKETEIKKAIKQRNFDFFYHVAADHETFAHISSIYVIPVRYIHLANPGLKEPLKEGEYVKVPVESAFPILDGKGQSTAQPGHSYQGGLNIKHTTVPVSRKVSDNTSGNTYVLPKQKAKSSYTRAKKSVFSPKVPVIKDYWHVVIQGETLESIARKYEISASQLKAVNPGLKIAVQGQRLRLPITAKVPGYHPSNAALKALKQNSKSANTNTVKHQQRQTGKKKNFVQHTVKPKETLYSISRKYGISLDELYRDNPGLTSQIKVGQIIRVPKKKITKPFLLYSSFKKTSLKKIARLYRMGFDLLKKGNPFINKKVSPGQVVKIPVEAQLQPENTAMEPESTSEEQQEAAVSERAVGVAGTSGCAARPHTKSFKVALMIPLYLEEIDSLNVNQFMMEPRKHFEPFRFVQFLEGALLASDSLQKQGMTLQLFVYDVDQKLTKTSKVLSKPELKNMDLIIGPFYSRSFDQVAFFANHFHIPIVNPLTFRNEVVRQHDDVVKVKPDAIYESGLLKKIIQRDYSNDKVFLISQSFFQDEEAVVRIRDSVKVVLPPSIKIPNRDLINLGMQVTQREKEAEQSMLAKKSDLPDDIQPVHVTMADTLNNYYLENQFVNPESLKLYPDDSSQFTNSLITINYAIDSVHPFENNASVVRKNLVILYGKNKAFIMDAMNRLNVLRDTFQIEMIGLPAWENFQDINLNQMNNLELTYPSSYYVDYQAWNIRKYQQKFRKTFGTDTDNYGILGFDITYYFMESLYLYGNRMLKCLDKNPKVGLSTRFKFVPSRQNSNSFENSYWNMIRIQNLQRKKVSK